MKILLLLGLIYCSTFLTKSCEPKAEKFDNIVVEILPNPVIHSDTLKFSVLLSVSTSPYQKVDSVEFEFHSEKGSIKEKLFRLKIDRQELLSTNKYQASFFLKSPIKKTERNSLIMLRRKIFIKEHTLDVSEQIGWIQ